VRMHALQVREYHIAVDGVATFVFTGKVAPTSRTGLLVGHISILRADATHRRGEHRAVATRVRRGIS
jgi:hypothetical protein